MALNKIEYNISLSYKEVCMVLSIIPDDDLKEMLDNSIKQEKYELCSEIKKELNKRKNEIDR